MSYQPSFDAFSIPEQSGMAVEPPLPATEKQMRYAQQIAVRIAQPLPKGIAANRTALSRWIDTHKDQPAGPFSAYPSSKQVAFAERIARIKQRDIPRECFRDKTLMSRWIDGNKPR